MVYHYDYILCHTMCSTADHFQKSHRKTSLRCWGRLTWRRSGLPSRHSAMPRTIGKATNLRCATFLGHMYIQLYIYIYIHLYFSSTFPVVDVACDILTVFFLNGSLWGVSTSCRTTSCWASCLRPGGFDTGGAGGYSFFNETFGVALRVYPWKMLMMLIFPRKIWCMSWHEVSNIEADWNQWYSGCFFWGAEILIGRGSRWRLGSGDVSYPYWRVICAPKDSLESQSVRNFFGQLQIPPGFWTIWKGNHLGFGASPISGQTPDHMEIYG